jgi:hypothetical protein
VIAPQRIAPTTVEFAEVVQAINRHVWRWSDRYVLARDTSDLEAVWNSETHRRSRVIPTDGENEIASAGAAEVRQIHLELWARLNTADLPAWVNCRLVWTSQVFDAADRELLLPPCGSRRR